MKRYLKEKRLIPIAGATKNGPRVAVEATKSNRRLAVIAVKLVHSVIFLAVALSVLHIFYAGVTDRASRLTKVALAITIVESLIFGCNGWRCPLRLLAEDLGAESGQVTDIFLPRWFADRIPLFFTPLLIVGIVSLVWNEWRKPLLNVN